MHFHLTSVFYTLSHTITIISTTFSVVSAKTFNSDLPSEYSLQNYKILAQSKLEVFGDDKIKMALSTLFNSLFPSLMKITNNTIINTKRKIKMKKKKAQTYT